MNSEEKRRYFRLGVKRKTKCKFNPGKGARFRLLSMVDMDVQILNLSLGGACIYCAGSLAAGTLGIGSIVDLAVPVRGDFLTLSGIVVWQMKTDDGVRAGVSFGEIDDETRSQLLQFLKEELRFTDDI